VGHSWEGGGNDTAALGGKINSLNEKNVNLLLKNFKKMKGDPKNNCDF
jgi:hypothetical protein